MKLKAQNTIEFLVVFIALMLFSLIVADIALYFRQTYIVQTISDEALQALTVKGLCSPSDNLTAELSSIVQSFYQLKAAPEFSVKEIEGIEGGYLYISNSTSSYSTGAFTYALMCKSQTYPASLNFSFKYKGVFIVKRNKYINSNPSVNNIYY